MTGVQSSICEHDGKDYLHTRSCTYKYQGAVNSYQDKHGTSLQSSFNHLSESMPCQVTTLHSDREGPTQ